MKYFKNDIFTNHGDPIHIIYSPIVNSDGSIELVESGKENTDDIIQSYLPNCEMSQVIDRINNGEIGLLNQRQGMYGDFTDMPKTYAEMLQLQIDSQIMFDRLPVEIKQKFDNDANKFFVQSGSKEWYEKLGIVEDIEKGDTKTEET